MAFQSIPHFVALLSGKLTGRWLAALQLFNTFIFLFLVWIKSASGYFPHRLLDTLEVVKPDGQITLAVCQTFF